MNPVDYAAESVVWSVFWFALGVLSTLATQILIQLWRTK